MPKASERCKHRHVERIGAHGYRCKTCAALGHKWSQKHRIRWEMLERAAVGNAQGALAAEQRAHAETKASLDIELENAAGYGATIADLRAQLDDEKRRHEERVTADNEVKEQLRAQVLGDIAKLVKEGCHPEIAAARVESNAVDHGSNDGSREAREERDVLQARIDKAVGIGQRWLEGHHDDAPNLVADLLATRRALKNVGALLAANGCDCDCDHHPSDHADDCERCLACRIEMAMNEREAER
jgi:hypothetical protein